MGRKVAIGIGNYLRRDDGIGPKVIEQISLRELNKNFEIEDIATDGLRLFKYFHQAVEKIVIIDSAFMGRKPGTVMVFSPDQVLTRKTFQHISLHEGDLLNLINLARKLCLPIPEIKIIAIEPDQVNEGIMLSDCIQSKVDEVINHILHELS